jgi:urease beta subunit
MTTGQTVDGVLVQWGERLFYPSNRIVKPQPTPRLDTMMRRKAAVIRGRIVATVARRAPQVMVKVTGGGRGMTAIAAHFRYISKNGNLSMEDDRGVVRDGKESLKDLVDQWRHGGALIPEEGHRREAFNIMLSMPSGTDAKFVQCAAREFAAAELAGHRYVMVLHTHQANPHVHLSVRATGRDGSRLNPRKADLHRWRETFAEKLRGYGIEAEATRQATRGETRRFDTLWRVKARDEGRLLTNKPSVKSGAAHSNSRRGALEAWSHIMHALMDSDRPDDKALGEEILRFGRESPFLRDAYRHHERERERARERQRQVLEPQHSTLQRTRPDIEMER